MACYEDVALLARLADELDGVTYDPSAPPLAVVHFKCETFIDEQRLASALARANVRQDDVRRLVVGLFEVLIQGLGSADNTPRDEAASFVFGSLYSEVIRQTELRVGYKLSTDCRRLVVFWRREELIVVKGEPTEIEKYLVEFQGIHKADVSITSIE